jgi:hypothetical protein
VKLVASSGEDVAAFGPILPFATTALRCAVSWPVAKLTALTSFASFKQTATSQTTKRAARAATSPVLLGASQARRNLPARAFADTLVVFVGRTPKPTGSACRDALTPCQSGLPPTATPGRKWTPKNTVTFHASRKAFGAMDR